MYKKIRHPERPLVLHIFIGCEPKFIAQKLNRIKNNKFYYPAENFELEDDDDACVFDLKNELHGHFVMVLRSQEVTVESIAHEATHCAARHFRYIGQPLDVSSEESYCYMVGWISGIVHKMISKK